MKISRIEVKNLKKIADLDIQVPEDNRVICFVGENGSNKSSVLTYIYQMIRRTTQEKSPSDENDLFYQGTYDISQDAKEKFYYLKIALNEGGKEYTTSEASVSNFNSLNEESIELLKQEFPRSYDGKNMFLRQWWSMHSPHNPDDIVKNSVLLFRPSNRFEIPSCEKAIEETSTKMAPQRNVHGHRKFPFRVETGIEQATTYMLDVLLDYFIAMNNKTPSYSIYEDFMGVLRSIDNDFQQLTISRFPNKSVSSKNLPSLDALSSGQSDWLITAINIIIQISEISSASGAIIKDPYQVSGIVFIDEIDKNYHPKLQEEIVPWFLSKFPCIQFILSTHSPYLIRSLGENSLVIRLPDGDVLNEDFSYWDINEVVSKIFKRELGFTDKVNNEIKVFKQLIREGNSESALIKYKQLANKSDSLRLELNRISYTLADNSFIEAINEKG